MNRKDTRNSYPLIMFLNLQEFCPEIIFNVPQLLIKKQFAKGKQYVNRCLFIPEYYLYVVGIVAEKN